MDGPRNHGYGARSGYDVRTRCVCGRTERRSRVSPGELNQPASFGPAVLTSRQIEVEHESSCFGCNGRDRTADRPVPSWPWFARSPRLVHDPEAVPPMRRVDFSRIQEPTYKPQEEDRF